MLVDESKPAILAGLDLSSFTRVELYILDWVAQSATPWMQMIVTTMNMGDHDGCDDETVSESDIAAVE
jgi:hypothetical protein